VLNVRFLTENLRRSKKPSNIGEMPIEFSTLAYLHVLQQSAVMVQDQNT